MNREIKIKHIIPTTVADGHSINVRKDDTVDMIFVQVVEESETEVVATTAAAVRLTISQLRKLQEDIQQALTDHKKKSVESKTK